MEDGTRLRQLQLAKLERIKRANYRIDPLFWLEDRLGESREFFEWSAHSGYEGHVWDGTKDPLKTAWERIGKSYAQVQNDGLPDYRYVGIESATGTSKTFWLARLVFWFLDCFENSLVVTTGPKSDQLKLGLWSELGQLEKKIKRLHPKSQMYKLRLAMEDESEMDLEDMDEVVKSKSWHAVGFVAGTNADEKSADRARGFHRKHMLIILEECTGIAASVITAFKNTSTGLTNFIVAVGNPNDEHDPLHQFCEQKDVFHVRISALDYPNIVLNKELYAGAVTWASINSRTDEYGKDSPFWQAMVRGISPKQSADSLINSDWVRQCYVDEGKELVSDVQNSWNAAGIDVANSERGDKAAVAYGRENTLIDLYDFQCPNATHLAYNLVYNSDELAVQKFSDYKIKTMYELEIRPETIGVDAVGVGVATINAFKDLGMEVQALHGSYWDDVVPKEELPNTDVVKPMYKFASLRAQMYWELREDLRNKKINIALKDKEMRKRLEKELCIPQYKASDKYITVESKESIKKRMRNKSPNLADAVAYWNWTRKGYRMTMKIDLPIAGRRLPVGRA